VGRGREKHYNSGILARSTQTCRRKIQRRPRSSVLPKTVRNRSLREAFDVLVVTEAAEVPVAIVTGVALTMNLVGMAMLLHFHAEAVVNC
jgi:hypothetical protein